MAQCTRYHSSSVDPNELIPPLVAVIGPTGSGKSELAIRVALEVGGEIVNCDSVQLYRGFHVGTAKVSTEERRGVAHHLIDVLDAGQVFTAGDYSRRAAAVLHAIAERHRVPIVVGGTGFYLRALLEGLFPGPPRDRALRERLQSREARRPGSLHRILQRLDPKAGARIHPNDKNKLMRALEVRLVAGRPMSALFEQGRAPLTGFRPIKLGLDPARELLYRALDARTLRIFEKGLLNEVRDLLASGVVRTAKPFESLGYKQALAVVEGRMTETAALESTRLETRRYAKRQLTWFRSDPTIVWLDAAGEFPELERQAQGLILEFLANSASR